ncbi:S41 family peptidase [Sphingobacterium corticis]|uniref:S41 family peptidase n=1 Tax=Sphingobacterium corticis TaxID=1812823 RepID=A0ABW5NGU0_9SPHI
MLNVLLTIIFCFVAIVNLSAQEADNVSDLDFLYKEIRKMPSYKAQLKGSRSYRKLYLKLRKELQTADDLEAYKKLAQLIYPIKDNHLGFWVKPGSNLEFQYPSIDSNRSELIRNYATNNDDELEGIYIHRLKKDTFLCVIKDESIYHFRNKRSGQLELILMKGKDGASDVIHLTNPPFVFYLNRGVRLINGKLGNSSYVKVSEKAYAPKHFGKEDYEYRKLGEEIGYLRLGSFKSNYRNIGIATRFLSNVRSEITAQNLIVDLRGNSGGGYKTSKQFLAFLKQYSGQLFILQNSSTVSNAEQFILALKGKKNVVSLGETTRGMLTYGSNYGKEITLPSGRFVFYPTDMKGLKKHLAYENVGIQPEIPLDAFGADWLDQTVHYIRNKTSPE